MILFTIRIIIFTILPLLLAGTIILIDQSTSSRERRLEVFLIFLFALGVAGSGIGGFFGHLFLSDLVAESIGWPAGNPFQLEMGFANLAMGVLGIVAVSRRDGFREATVIAITILGVGATIVHIMDIVQTGNLAPGNTLQNLSNLLKPALLIGFLVATRRAEARPDPETGTTEFDQWREPFDKAAGIITAVVATAFGLGFGVGQPVLLTLLGVLISLVILVVIINRSPWHQFRWQ